MPSIRSTELPKTQKFERHLRLQHLRTENYVDAFAFHVTGVAETWFETLPASQQSSWEVLRAACRERNTAGGDKSGTSTPCNSNQGKTSPVLRPTC